MTNLLRVSKTLQHVDNIKHMSKRERFLQVDEVKDEGGDWQAVAEHIRQVVDPMTVLPDTEIFGVEFPWDSEES
jgi:hypothetical protein